MRVEKVLRWFENSEKQSLGRIFGLCLLAFLFCCTYTYLFLYPLHELLGYSLFSFGRDSRVLSSDWVRVFYFDAVIPSVIEEEILFHLIPFGLAGLVLGRKRARVRTAYLILINLFLSFSIFGYIHFDLIGARAFYIQSVQGFVLGLLFIKLLSFKNEFRYTTAFLGTLITHFYFDVVDGSLFALGII